MDDQQVDQILGGAESLLQEINQSPVPGQKPSVQELLPLVDQVVQQRLSQIAQNISVMRGPPGPPGQPGESVDEAEVLEFIRKEISTLPKPKDGKDGKDGKPGKIKEIRNTIRVSGKEDFAASDGSSYIGFLQSGIAASATTLQEKIRNGVPVDVKSDFDAVGDGSNDDTAEIQAALDSGAKRVFLPPGNYKVTSVLSIPSNMEFFGMGDSSVLELGANADVINVTGKSNVVLRDFKVDGKSATYTSTGNEGIYVNWTSAAGSNVKIRRVTVVDCNGTGIQCLASSGTASTDLWIEDCDVEGCGAHAIISQDYISNVWIRGNRVKDWGLAVSDRVGITASRDGQNVVVSDNIAICSGSAMGTSVHGISIDQTTNATVRGNVVEDTIGFGIEMGIVNNGTCSGNTVNNSTRASIAVSGIQASSERGVNIAVVGNTITGGSAQGIYAFITGADGTLFHENITISGNSINGHTNTTSGYGMQLEFCDKLNVNGNSVYNSGLTGVYFVDSRNFFVDGNLVVNNNCGDIKSAAITLSGSTATVTAAGHGYSNGNTITIFGANPARYNGSYSITNVTTDTFDYTAASGLLSPAVGNIKCVKPNNTSHGGIRVSYSTVTTKNQWSLGRNHVYGNGFREIYDVSVNGIVGLGPDDSVILKEGRFGPRAENLTSGEASNIKDRCALLNLSDKFVIAYNNSGTVTYISIPLDGSTTTWTHSTTAP